ncbi:hypothetical protein [Gordonia polyisoprenivorans]|uniref:hypothetical protein n=1 Tax=Gordonia polyisoprenivorans TaxID=84595 RepID=UPI00037FA3E8|nr:hypothetical protein [Gordonia polyisoprenivorans]
MPTTTTEAQAALDEARAAHTALEEAIRDGDDTITSATLAAATAEIRTAVLRLEAAQRAEERTAEATRAHDAEVVRQEFDKLVGKGSEKARKAYAAAVDALRTLATEADTLHTARARLVSRAGEVGVELPAWDTLRVIDTGGEVFVERAAKEARGHQWPHPHALHTDQARRDYQAEQDRLAEQERARAEAAEAQGERGYFVGTEFVRTDV